MKKLIVCLIFSIFCFTAEQNYFIWGSSARMGDRNGMEDRSLHLNPLFDDFQQGLFGIFDGHGGHQTANYAVDNFIEAYGKNNYHGIPKYPELFNYLNSQILSDSTCNAAGTCALIGYIKKYQVHLAWIGDSRAVWLRDGKVQYETIDHKPNITSERARIESLGVEIYSRTGQFGTFYRCCGIAVSRALGNRYRSLEENFSKAIISTPDVYENTAQSGDLLIFACDGIWDVFKSDEIPSLIQKTLNTSYVDLEKLYPTKPFCRTNNAEQCISENGDEYLKLVARALRDEAYNKGSGDNLSVQIIQFK